jgi:hypothetical protein
MRGRATLDAKAQMREGQLSTQRRKDAKEQPGSTFVISVALSASSDAPARDCFEIRTKHEPLRVFAALALRAALDLDLERDLIHPHRNA